MNNKLLQACLFGGLVFLLPACVSQHSPMPHVHEDEARLTDIPVNLGWKRVDVRTSETIQPGQSIVRFESDQERDEVVTYCAQEMERYGWQQVSIFIHDESVLVFEKPSKVAVILLRKRMVHKQPKVRITICMSMRYR